MFWSCIQHKYRSLFTLFSHCRYIHPRDVAGALLLQCISEFERNSNRKPMADYLDGSPEPSNWQDLSSSNSSSELNYFDAGEDSSPPTSPELPSSIIEYTPATSLTDAGRDTLVTLVGLGVGFSITFRNDHSYTFDIHERPSAMQSCKSKGGTASKCTDNAKGTSNSMDSPVRRDLGRFLVQC